MHTCMPDWAFFLPVGAPIVCPPPVFPSTNVDFCRPCYLCHLPGNLCRLLFNMYCSLSISINFVPAQCLWATIIHPPPVPCLITIEHLWPMLPMSVAWGVLHLCACLCVSPWEVPKFFSSILA